MNSNAQLIIGTKQVRLSLAGHISAETLESLEKLPCFDGAETETLCRQAEVKLRGLRKISDRVTAMLVIVGTRYLDHPDLQIPIR